MRLGFPNYINALPFVLPIKVGAVQIDAELALEVPTALSSQLQAQQLDLALTSSTMSFEEHLFPLSDFCISARQEVLSVNLYLKGSLDGARIALTSESSTSALLLKILAHHHWRQEPTFVPLEGPLDSYDGFLLIGDEALCNLKISGYKTIDLAKQWYEMTALPFVFARLVAIEPHNHSRLLEKLEEALEWSRSHLDQILTAAAQKCSLPRPLLHRYYNLLSYELTSEGKQSLQLFKQMSAHVQPCRP